MYGWNKHMRRECRWTFFLPPTSKEIARYRPRHASQHVRHGLDACRERQSAGGGGGGGGGGGALLAHAQPAISRIW